MEIELIETYRRNLAEYNKGNRTREQWNDVCLWVLAEIMDQPENRKVLDRLNEDEANR